MVKQWKDYFKNKEVLSCGCGRGPYLYAWDAMDVHANGFDKSTYAVTHSLNKSVGIWLADILDEPLKTQFELVTAIDILEHLKYEDLDTALDHIHKMTKKDVLFSIPYLFDPNLEADPTHIIKEDKEWWLEQLDKYFKIRGAPTSWLYGHQFLIGEKK